MLHEDLWRENADLATACRSHPFVRGLEDGSLAQDAFRRYIAQDAFFLRAFVRAYAVALAKCDDVEHARQFHTFIGGALEELKLHAAYATQLRLELEQVEPLRAARAYTDFLTRTAWQSSAGHTRAAMTPCLRLYTWLGHALAPAGRPGHPYGDGIRTCASGEFDALARAAETLLDVLSDDTPAVHDAYRHAMACELEFFDASLQETA